MQQKQPMLVTVSISAYGHYDPNTKKLTLDPSTKEEELSCVEFEDNTIPPLKNMPEWDWEINRNTIMDVFRNEEIHELLSPDDTMEIFMNILHGSGDITHDTLDMLCSNYGVDLQEVITQKKHDTHTH